MDADLAGALLAGWIAGAVAGLTSTAAVLIVAARSPSFAARLPARRLPLLGIVLANGLTIGLTLVGLLLGGLFYRLGGEGAGGALRFGAAVLVVAVGFFGLYVFVRSGLRGREAPIVVVALGVAGVCFGVLLPWLGLLAS
ncbi:MAG: hypothetical protein DWG80_06245 [Chloroflexi bacterium]|nr:hypothetical protein [Chloroflexota bacterium]